MFRKPKLSVLFLSLFMFGCVGRPTSIIPSTSPLPPHIRGDIETEGSDCQYRLLGLLPVTGAPNTQDALSEAKEDADVDVLTDVTVDHTGSYYILYGTSCVYVRGLGVSRELTDNIFPEDFKAGARGTNRGVIY